MYIKKNLLSRTIALVLALTIVLPTLPIQYFGDLIPVRSEVRAAEITGDTHTYTINNNVLSNIQNYLSEASQNPNDLYILNITSTSTTTITTNTTFKTDGNVIIKRTDNSKGVALFTVNSGVTFNIGSADMKGTIKIDGGAEYTLDTSMSYNFDTERPTGSGGNGTKNVKAVNNIAYVLFNDGESYKDAHWYKVTGVQSTTSLISTKGTLNIYDGVTIGNVSSVAASGRTSVSVQSFSGGAINNNNGTVNMHGGEISWNAIGLSNNGCGPAVYCGPESSSATTFTINGGKISNNTAVDTSNSSADGGAIAVDGGKLNINGGVISNNRAATGGTDKAADGGAIIARVGATIYMNDGVISDNFAGGFGGGVLLWNSTFYMYGGTIDDNFARYGGGVGMSTNSKSTFYMFNNATVSNNYADYGGGVCVGADGYAKNSDFTMFNGNIVFNYAEQAGGGICNYNESNCAVDLRSGLISNNKVSASGKGNGFCIYNTTTSSTETLLYMSGAIVVDTNNDIYINRINNNQIPVKVEGRLTADGSIGMLAVDSWQNYVNRNIVHFERDDGGILEVQTNKLSIDTDKYLLVENGEYLKLSSATDTTATFYVARVGDRLYTSLASAVEALQDGGSVYLINNVTLTETIEIDKNVNILSETSISKNAANVIDGTWKDSTGKTITNLQTYQPLGDYTIALASSFGDNNGNTSAFVIKNGAKLIIGDSTVNAETISTTNGGKITLDGNSSYKIDGALFDIETGGTLDANYGIVISNNSVNSGINGAGVIVDGTFNLNGAIIKNNNTSENGGGVYVTGTFNFNNGKIEMNESQKNGAGVYVVNGGEMYAKEGEISSNKANGSTSNGAAIYLEGGSYLENKNLTISSNEAEVNGAGIYIANGAEAIFEGGIINKNKAYNGNGAGIYNLGSLIMNGGTISGNEISLYNANPKGTGIYTNGTMKVANEIRVNENNPVYLTTGNVIEVSDSLLYPKAIPVITETSNNGTKVIYVNTGNDNTSVAEQILANKSIYHVEDKNIVKSSVQSEEGYLIIGNIGVNYDANNAETGSVPQDNSEYLGGDLVTILPNSGNLKRTNYVFVGWSTVEATPITSSVAELQVPIYYEAGNMLIPGTVYQEELRIYSNLTLYAVWAVDANNNTTPDYREDMLDITVEPSEHGSATSSVTEAQSGTLVMISTTQDDGYEVKTIEVVYEINGVEEKMTLANGKVVALTDSYYYFHMPIASVKIITTFGEQSNMVARVTWLDANNNESTEDFVNLQIALNEIASKQADGTMRAKKVTLLRYVYSTIDITVPENLNFELELSNYELDMNSHIFTISQNSTIKFTANTAQGRINFNATGGNSGTNGNNLLNNGTLILNGANIVTDAGEDATKYTIINNGDLQVLAGTVKHEDEDGVAIYNAGTLTITGGNINGGTYGIEHVNTADTLDLTSNATETVHSLNISGMGTEATYGINADNYISSIYLAKDTHINVPTIFGNCIDNVVKTENKIRLIMEDTKAAQDIVLTSNKLPFMLPHFKMHFALSEANYEIGITANNLGILIEKISSLETNPTALSFEYKTPIELNATLLKSNGDAFVGAKGNVYFFVINKSEEVAEWSKIWDESNNKFRVKETTADGEEIYYSLQDATGYARIDETTGIATLKLSGVTLPISEYVIYAMYVGEYEYASHALDIDLTTGSQGPIIASRRGTFNVAKKAISNTTIMIEDEKSYTGSEIVPSIQIYDGSEFLEENKDYQIFTTTQLINADSYTITILGIGNYTGVSEETFVISKYSDEIKIEGVNSKYIFNDQVPTIDIVVKDMYSNILDESDYKVTYYKYQQSTDTYEQITRLLKDVGVYKIKVTGTGVGNYASTILQETAFVISEDLGAQYEVSIENTSLTYNGELRELSELGEIKITNLTNGNILVENRDYIVKYGVSTVKNAREYPVIIQGIGNYSEISLIEVITINPKQLNNDNTTIIFAESEFIYNRKAQKPTIANITVDGVNTQTVNGGTPLVADTDYVLSLTDNINAGEALIELTALNGNYTGKVEKTFTILPKDITNEDITSYIYQSGYTGNEIIPTITLLDENSVLIQGQNGDYKVEYIADNDGAALSSNGYPVNKGSYKAVITGIGNYTGEIIKTFVVANYKGKIIATLSPNKYTYLGNGDSLEATIKEALNVIRGTDGEELVQNEDYVLRYNSPENEAIPSEVGEYLLYVVGIGNYDGTQTTAEFVISPLTGSVHIEVEDDELIYNGKIQHPTVILNATYLTIAGEKVYLSDLRENVDYMITYPNSTNVGNYILQINGVGNYAGNYNFHNYSISPKTLDAEDITIKSALPITKYYDGTNQTLTISPVGDIWVEYKLQDGTVVLLEEGRDFSTYYSNNVNAGYASLILMGKGNYNELKVYTYIIETRSIGLGTVAEGFEITTLQDKAYTGTAITQEIVLKDIANSKVLTENKDYTVSYLNNLDVGTATVTIEGEGNYSGTINLTFDITMDHTLTIIAESKYEYTAAKVEFPVTVKDSLGFVLTEDDFDIEYFVDSACTQKTTNANSGADVDGAAPVKAGTYYRKVTGTSKNYVGLTATQEFSIDMAKSFQVNITNTTNTYDSTNKNATVVVIDSMGATLSTDDYKVVYYTNSNCTNKTTAEDGATINGGAPKNAGKYYVQAEGLGVYDGIKSNAEFVITPRSLENVDIAAIDDIEYTSTAIAPKPLVTFTIDENKITLIENEDYIYNYENNLNAGKATIQIVPHANSRNYVGSKNVSFVIAPKAVTIIPDTLTKEYRDENPEYTFTTNLSNANENGLLGTDTFEGKLERVAGENVGEYGYTIQNLKATNYELALDETVKFKIEVKDINDSNIIFSGTEDKYTYTSNVIAPVPQAIHQTSAGNITLSVDTDFEVIGYEKKNEENGNYEAISNPISVGEYKIIIKGKNNYTGTKTLTYNIEALKAFNATITNTTKEFNRENQTASVVVKSAEGSLVENRDYKLVYYTDAGYTLKTTTADMSGARSEGGAPRNVGDYYLRVEGIGNYKGSSAESEFRITPKNITDKVNGNYEISISDILDMTYTGTEITPAIALTWNGIELETNEYTVTYKNNVEVGVATVTITGANNYDGARLINFNIVAITGGTVKIALTDENGNAITDDTYVYDGTYKEPNVAVTYTPQEGEEIVLEKDKDYVVSFTNSINAGTAGVEILLTGNYSGTATTSYKISPRDLSDSDIEITVIPVSETYNGKAEYPEVMVKYKETLLTGNKDYTVNYGNTEYLNVGEYTITVASTTGNFVGTVNDIYTIKPYGIVNTEYLILDFENNNSAFNDQTFSQIDIENKIIVKDLNGNTLLPRDYDVFYSSDNGNTWSVTPNTTVGDYFIKVTGKANGNYAGEYATATRGYSIYTDNLVANDITVTYDGTAHTIASTDLEVRTAAGVLLDPTEYEVTFGNIEVKEAGSYTIFITSEKANANSTATYHIVPATFTVGTVQDKTYNGLLEVPEIEIKGVNNSTLINGVDYQLSYEGTTIAGAAYESNKAPIVAGNYTIKVIGRANYAGTEEIVEYNILPKSLADANVVVTLNESQDVYDTFTQKITTRVYYVLSGHTITLVEGVDYEVVSDKEYIDAGEYTIKISAKQGNYTGNAETIYKVVPYTGKIQVEMSGTIFNYGTTISQMLDELTVEYASETLTKDMYEANIYPLASNIPEVGSYTLTITAKSPNYSNGSESAQGSIKFTVIPASAVVVSFVNQEVIYNGLEKKPTKDEILVEGKSINEWAQEGKIYEVDYGTGNYKDAASYAIAVSYYEGGILKEQSVATYKIKNAEVTITPDDNQGKTYGQLDEKLTYTTNITTGNTGLYEDDVLSGSLTRVQGEIVGEYEIKQKDLIADNYDITVSTGVKYEIAPKDLNNTDIIGIDIAGIQNAYTYTGTAIRPRPTITYLSDMYGTLALVENTDYKLTYKYHDEATDTYITTTEDSKLKSVGNYKVVIEGIGNYTGTVEMQYTISAYVTSFKAIITNNYKQYNKLNQTAQVEVTGVDSVLVEGTDYEIVYYTDVACTTPTTVSDNSGAMQVGGAPKNVGTYYIQVEGIGNYTGSTAKAIFDISPKDISSEGIVVTPILDQTYVGEEIKPVVTVTWDEVLGNNDYEVTYKNNKEIGRATVTIKGIGNYTGTRTTRFNIVAISGGTITVELLEGGNTVSDITYTYDGTEKKPDVEVVYETNDETKTLVQDTDYKVTYTNTVNAGIVQVTITLIGNYSGTATKTYLINQADLTNATVELIPNTLTYTGEAQKPNVQVKYENMILESQRDYEVVYNGSFIDADEYEVVVKAVENSNYKGTNKATFTINKYGANVQDKLLLDFKDGNAAYQEMYDQTTFENNLLVTDLNHNILEKTDYEVMYSADGTTWNDEMPTEVGTYYVKVSGTGNNYIGPSAIAQRAFIIYVEKLTANDVIKEYKAGNFTINDIVSDITLTSDEGTTLNKEDFAITFGAVEPRNVGKYTIIITGKPGSGFENLSGTATFEITPAELKIESVTNITYNGMVQIPEMTVSGIPGETVEEGRDYTVRYTGTDVKGNEYDSTIPPIVVGTYKVSIIGRGNYVDSTDNKDFEIGSVGIGTGDFVVGLITPQMTYNTTVQKPIVNAYYVTDNYVLTLEENKDFEIEYNTGNYIDVGQYTITVKALSSSNYSGSKDITFEIVPYVGSLNVTLDVSEFKNGVSKETIIENLTVTYLNDTLTPNDYTVTFEPNELIVGNAVIKVSAKGDSLNYYSDADSYAKGYTTFKIVNAEPITVELVNETVKYNGEEQKPTFDEIIVRGKTITEWLASGIEYTVDYGSKEYKLPDEYEITISLFDTKDVLQEQATITYVIEKAEVTVTPKDNQNKVYGQVDGTFEYTTDIETSNGLYADDTFEGSLTRVNGENVGEYEIKQKDLTSASYNVVVEAGINYTIAAKDLNNTDITGITITGVQNTYTYTGTAIRPRPTITYLSDMYGTLALVENRDYKVTYKYYDEATSSYITTTEDSKLNSVGNYKVVIEGIGNYIGIVEIQYTISAYVTNFNAVITDNYKQYNKLNQTAQVQVTGVNGTLTHGTDYKVVYYKDLNCTIPTTVDNSGATQQGGAPKDANTYYVQVEGIGNYAGSTAKAIFVISPKDISDEEIVISSITEQTYIGEEIEPVFTLAWEETLQTNVDYTVEYEDNKEIGRATVTIKGIGNYTGMRTTRFNIVAISGGTITINLLEAGNTVNDTTYTYDGTEKKPDVEVVYETNDETKTLVQDTDYTVTYTNTVNAGTVQVTITLIGNYSGTATKTYLINQADLTNATVELIPNTLTYTGVIQKPNVQVKYKDMILESQRDYEVVYNGSFIEADEYEVVIRAVENSNYRGTNKATFTINKYGANPQDKLLLDFKDGNAAYQEMYDQTTFENNLLVTDLNNNILAKTDYEVKYSADGTTWNNEMPAEVGTYYVKVSGTGDNYDDTNATAQRTFIIYIEKLNANDISKEYKAENFTINDVIAEITLTSNEGTVLGKENFTITFGDVAPKNVGKYTIIISGNVGSGYENLSGTATFEITPSTLSIENITNLTYTGIIKAPKKIVIGTTGETIEEGRDYIVRYTGTDVKGNDYDSTIPPTAVGTYKLIIVGRGNYMNSTDEKSFTINPVTFDGDEFVVELTTSNEIYNTMAQKPVVTVYYVTSDYMITLKENKDFEVDYGTENYIDVGEYKILVKALSTSNYSGSKEVIYEITPYVGSLNVTLDVSEFKYGVSTETILENLTVTYLNETLTSDDYTVKFEPSDLVIRNAVIKVSAKDTSTNYYLDENSLAQGYTTFKIVNAEPITVELVNETVKYNGEEQKPTFDEIIVRNQTITEWLASGVEYTVDYGTKEYKLPGKYEITISLFDEEDVLQEKATIAYVIEKAKVTVTPKDNQNKVYGQLDGTLEYTTDIETSNGLYADDTFEGSLTRENGEVVGNYDILIGTLNSENYEIIFTENVKYEIKQKQLTNEDISGITMAGVESSYVYNGNSIIPSPILVYKNELQNNLALTKDTDYTVKYQKYNEETSMFEEITEELATEVGKYKVIVEGINNYTGAIEKEYLIISSSTGFAVTTVNGNKVFNGEAQAIDLKVELSDGTLLTENEHYELSYYTDIELTVKVNEPINAGTYYVQVLGKGNYESSKAIATFVIAPKNINELTIEEIVAQEYTGSAITPTPEIKFGDITLTKDTDYTLSYANNVNMGTNTASITITAKEDSNYTGNKTIYFSIKMNSTEEIIITIIDEDGNVVSDDTYYYDGNKKTPEVKVLQGSKELVKDTEYIVTYENNIEAGEATVKITLVGFYIGEFERNFTINKKEITSSMIKMSRNSFKYTGSNLKPDIEVTYNLDGKLVILKLNEDYEVIYPQISENVGTYQLIISAKGNNYIGSQTFTYTIIGNTDKLNVIWNNDTNLFEKGSKFTEETIKSTFTLKDSYGKVIPSDEFIVTFNALPNKAGTYTMTVTTTSANYQNAATGEQAKAVVKFHIEKSSLSAGGAGGGSSKEEIVYGIKGNVKELEMDVTNSLLEKQKHVSYINGYSDGKFEPNRNMTRAEVVTIFTRLLKNKDVHVSLNKFTDVENHWANESIAIMSELGIVKGYSDGTFRPQGNITRAEFATMISRFEEMVEMKNTSYFVDVSKNHWAYDTINYAYTRGWISGYEDKTFKPDSQITRAEAITIINRVLERTADINYLNKHSELNKYVDISNHWAYYTILEASISHEHKDDTAIEEWEYLWGEEFKVVYSLNDEEAKMFVDLSSYELGENVNLPQKAYSKTKKRFLGWSLTPDGKVLKKYNLSEENIIDNSIILYAIWK